MVPFTLIWVSPSPSVAVDVVGLAGACDTASSTCCDMMEIVAPVSTMACTCCPLISTLIMISDGVCLEVEIRPSRTPPSSFLGIHIDNVQDFHKSNILDWWFFHYVVPVDRTGSCVMMKLLEEAWFH